MITSPYRSAASLDLRCHDEAGAIGELVPVGISSLQVLDLGALRQSLDDLASGSLSDIEIELVGIDDTDERLFLGFGSLSSSLLSGCFR